MSGFIEVPSPAGDYTARLSPDDTKGLAKINKFLAGEPGSVGDHLINKHLSFPSIMQGMGYQYDAELGLFLGESLKKVATETHDTLIAMISGHFENTKAFANMSTTWSISDEIRRNTAAEQEELGLPGNYQPPPSIAWEVIEYKYQQNIATALGGLCKLGVVGDFEPDERALEAIELSTTPLHTDDSFFEKFNVIRT